MNETPSPIIIEGLTSKLAKAGMFRTSWIPNDELPADASHLPDGWSVVVTKDTVAAEAVYRIAGAIDVPVPPSDLAKGIVKLIISRFPEFSELYTSYPSRTATDLLAFHLGCGKNKDGYDLNRMSEVIAMTPDEERLHALLVATIDGCCAAARLVHQFGKTGKRTWFNDHFLPTVPFVIHDKGEPVRLVGHNPHPALHKNADEGRFVGLELSKDGNRCLLEFVVSEQSVEGNSFNVPVSAKAAIAGRYKEIRSKIPLTFSLDRKNARKFSGMGRVVRKLYPRYVAGQVAYVVLDKETGEALLELHDRFDDNARDRIRAMLDDGITLEDADVPRPAL